MSESEDVSELLFFDTFSHESDTDINLDLVQFPKPVFITQVRIIPLGARVQADFPGGVRLGATNPSKFGIEFFVNDLGMPGASAFENLGQLQYNQNDCIHLECTQEKIPTDGLVLRGWYSTITLAVYGILTNSLTENIASPPPAPCEPEEMEEIPIMTGDALPEVEIKEEWKEPLPGDLNTISHEQELDYEGLRVRGSDGLYRRDSGEERDRRLRKSSRSSERSPSSRNRCHSESNEYMRNRERDRERERDKPLRDWSRSPVYARHSRRKRSDRSRSDVDEQSKWPRTPPASIDSPVRPRSPDYTDEESSNNHYKTLKTRSYRRSSESMAPSSNIADLSEPCIIEDDDNPGTPVEQYEPILSDDEIMGDDQDNDSNTNEEPSTNADEFEQEIQSLALKAKPAIIEFDIFTQPIQKFSANSQQQYQKDVDIFKTILKKFELQSKCENEISFKDAATTTEEKESFVFLCEQLINHLTYINQNYKRRQHVLPSVLKNQQHLKLLSKICIIALDFEAACCQPQPAFKIRHIKTGARLMELLAPSEEIFNYLLNNEKFDPFTVVLSLYHQNYMALSIKLLLLKTIYSLLDCKAALQHFLSPAINGYEVILDLLQTSKLTRTKYFLQSIIKKLHLNESLTAMNTTCTQLFVITNYDVTSHEPYQTLEACMQQLLDALQENCLSYQQPKRFLPVSKKFEISVDAAAQTIFANTLRSYFVQHSLAESLLLIISNSSTLPSSLLVTALDVLRSLLQCSVGIDYLTDDCFEVTQLLVATLLGLEEVPADAEESGELKELVEVKHLKSDDTAPAEGPSNEKSTENIEKSPQKTEESKPKELETKEPNSANKDIEIASPEKDSSTPTDVGFKEATNHHKDFVKLATELAYKIQTRYHLDAIVFYSSVSEIYDTIALATHLHALYSQTCNAIGRHHTVEVLGLNKQMQVFMDLIKHEQRLQAQRQLTSPGSKYKSPVLSYAVDMVDCCVRYCENLDYLIDFGKRILELAKNHEAFEPSVSAVLQEMFVYIKPLEAINIFAYDDITPLVEVITRSLEYITTFPGDLIMGLRILRHLAIGTSTKIYKSADTEELKHRYVALQFYAADGMQTLLQILEKLCAYFEQPGLHTPALMTLQGVHCCQIILPTLQIIREMLSFAIQCRDVDFKDLNAIDHLMRTYYLLHYFPATSPAAPDVEKSKYEIIQTLLAYTQPNEQDEELLHKSLWTQMIREILKNIDGPSTFIPGLLVLAELLPLPLPLPITNFSTNIESLKTQAQHLIRERKLWSAHLHPQGVQIARLIETMAHSSFPQLSDLIIRVCLQLADLAPNMTLLISKTLSDLLINEWSAAGQQPSAHLARLLQFFSRLNAFASLKISTLSILSGKLWDFLNGLLTIKTSTEVGIKCQISVHRILESFLDSEISFIASSHVEVKNNNSNPLLNLATALPHKELIPKVVEAIFTNLMQVEVTSEVSAMGVRNLVILTEHDTTFYHLSMILKQKSTEFQEWVLKIINLNDIGSYNSNIESLVLLLRSLTQIEDLTQQYSCLPERSLKLSCLELAQIIGFKKEEPKSNIIESILAILERNKEDINETLLTDIQQLKELIDNVNSNEKIEEETISSAPEPQLPQTESIVTQYDARPIFTTYDPQHDDDQMMAHHWLHILNIEALTAADFETQFERIACDLSELAQSCLSPECNLSSDCKRLLHLSASPQSNRERTPTAPCFRTRRVEVEPSTGRPEKKIYITSMRGRGFPRPPPSRGDLFRSRPPNTSRPPSLHVDDFLALETCGAQPTGPTGYNKIPPLMRGSRVGRNRGSRISAVAAYRKTKILRTGSPSTWNELGSPHYRSNPESHFSLGPGELPHYATNHFTGRIRGRGMRSRPYMR